MCCNREIAQIYLQKPNTRSLNIQPSTDRNKCRFSEVRGMKRSHGLILTVIDASPSRHVVRDSMHYACCSLPHTGTLTRQVMDRAKRSPVGATERAHLTIQNRISVCLLLIVVMCLHKAKNGVVEHRRWCVWLWIDGSWCDLGRGGRRPIVQTTHNDARLYD